MCYYVSSVSVLVWIVKCLVKSNENWQNGFCFFNKWVICEYVIYWLQPWHACLCFMHLAFRAWSKKWKKICNWSDHGLFRLGRVEPQKNRVNPFLFRVKKIEFRSGIFWVKSVDSDPLCHVYWLVICHTWRLEMCSKLK